MLARLSCCCPKLTRERLREDDGAAMPMEPMMDPESIKPRKRTVHARRAAVTSENSELLASVRWRAAFDALRRSEPKSPERVKEIIAVLRVHSLFSAFEETLLRDVAFAMREHVGRSGDAVIAQGEAGDKLYLVAEGKLAAYVGDALCVCRYDAGDIFGEVSPAAV